MARTISNTSLIYIYRRYAVRSIISQIVSQRWATLIATRSERILYTWQTDFLYEVYLKLPIYLNTYKLVPPLSKLQGLYLFRIYFSRFVGTKSEADHKCE